jgi:hypothetical protein
MPVQEQEPVIDAFDPEALDLDELIQLGRILDRRPMSLGGDSVLMTVAERLLCIRTRGGATAPLRANAVQRLFE